MDAGHESVAPFGNGFDVPYSILSVVQDFAQKVDRLAEVALLDRRIGPDRLHQFVFLHQAAAVFDQRQESVENPGRKLHPFIAFQKGAFLGIQAEGTELV
jgi:hypothetical protein